MRSYYEAYDERYKTIHDTGYSWAGEENTPAVTETIMRYRIPVTAAMLETGCGEGRDAVFLMKKGFDLLATDVSPEAISYCRRKWPEFENRFRVLDCLKDETDLRFDFIYSVAVIHMFLTDEDRGRYCRFIRDHLKDSGIALICCMGDGISESATDAADAFMPVKRAHPSGEITVAATSLRTVSFEHLGSELSANGLAVIEKGFTSCMPDFDSLMYAVVKRNG